MPAFAVFVGQALVLLGAAILSFPSSPGTMIRENNFPTTYSNTDRPRAWLRQDELEDCAAIQAEFSDQECTEYADDPTKCDCVPSGQLSKDANPEEEGEQNIELEGMAGKLRQEGCTYESCMRKCFGTIIGQVACRSGVCHCIRPREPIRIG